MAIPVNLAMTGAEFCHCPHTPPRIAWMACRFSAWGPALSNLPRFLPGEALLILDDQTPMNGHDPGRIAGELGQCISDLGCCGVLLDFERPRSPESQSLADHLAQTLPCPVAVTPSYAKGSRAAVFLPPLPCHVPLEAWTAPWQDREIWLELSLDRETITLTDRGADISPGNSDTEEGFADKKLHCHYKIAVEEDQAVFSLWRTKEDLTGLLQEADKLGIARAVGLYQELGRSDSAR